MRFFKSEIFIGCLLATLMAWLAVRSDSNAVLIALTGSLGWLLWGYERFTHRSVAIASTQQANGEGLLAQSNRSELSPRHLATLTDGLARQVVIALEEAEHAVSAAIHLFDRITNGTQELADTALQMLEDESEHTIVSVADQAMEAMNGLVERIQITAHQVSGTAEQFQTLTSDSDTIERLLQELESTREQVSALIQNGANAGGKTSKAGRLLAVIAAEVQILSEQSRVITEQIGSLNRKTQTVFPQFQACAERSQEESLLAQDKLDALQTKIHKVKQQTERTLASITEQRLHLNNDIGRIMIAFQFHDLLRQRLEHVADPLYALRDQLSDGTFPAEEPGQSESQLRTGTEGGGLTPLPTHQTLSVGTPPPLSVVTYDEAQAKQDITLF